MTRRAALAVASRVRRLDRRREPAAPHFGTTEEQRAYGTPPAGNAFVTGNGIASRCRYVLNYGPLAVNEDVDNDWWFCKTDYLDYFFAKHAPSAPFVLFSHNSDHSVDGRYRRYLRRRSLVAWFASNPAIRHRKLHALPVGIANPQWPHGDQDAIERVRAAAPAKTELFDASYSVVTNERVRRYCVKQTDVEPRPARPYAEYMHDLASAYFCISPEGHGIDCHRTWESLAVGTIPIVTRSAVVEQHADFPLIVLDDWADFRTLDFDGALYERSWHDWNPNELRLDRYVERIERLIEPLRG